MLKTTFGGISLDCCIYNASGPRTGSVEALLKVATSRSGAVLSKSATLVKQDGNQLPRFVNKIKMGDFCEGSLNSEGLPNLGIDYYIGEEALDALATKGKPYIVSLSGLSLSDNLKMIEMVLSKDSVTAIELNLACPNIPGKPVMAYDFEQMENVLAAVMALPNIKKKPFGIKLAPYFDSLHADRAIAIISKYPIQYIVTTNTIGNGLIIDFQNECAAIAPKGGLGGLGGGYIKPIALANVFMLKQKLHDYHRDDIDIVGVGGVHTGQDVFELILCGAKAVQIGTCHWTEGPSCFDRIAKELEDIMNQKGYKSIIDFCGKLKPYTKPTKSTTNLTTSTTNNNNKEGKGENKISTDISKSGNDMIYQAIIVVLLALLGYIYTQGIHI